MQVLFEVNGDKITQVREDDQYSYWARNNKKPANQVYVEIEPFYASLILVDIHRTGNGYMYAEWRSSEGITYFSSFRDAKHILNNAERMMEEYLGVYTFRKRDKYVSIRLLSSGTEKIPVLQKEVAE